MNIGWAQTSITPVRPVVVDGQMYQRYSGYVHDPLTATALFLEQDGVQATLVSMDMAEVPVHAFPLIREQLKQQKEIDFDKISFSVVHSHNSSAFFDDSMREDSRHIYGEEILPKLEPPEGLLTGAEAQAFFVRKISALIIKAWENRRPGGISTAHDYAAVAFNRRPQFGKPGCVESRMYGDCSRQDFVKFEGGIDTAVELLYTWNPEGALTGVAVNVPCPSQVYELHTFLSADYWGPTRAAIRQKLQKNIYILPLCGAAGDLSPIDLVQISKHNRQALLDWGGQTKEVLRNFDMTLRCQEIGEIVSDAVLRGYRKAGNYIEDTPVFRHAVLKLSLPIRQVSRQDYEEAVAQAAEIRARFSGEHPMTMEDFVAAFEPQGVVLRYEQQQENSTFSFACHLLRLGAAALATNPFELFCEYGQRLKARARADQVFVVQLSNAQGVYLPTRDAVAGGSYSAKPASTVCGPEGGDELVEQTLAALDRLWDEE